jgi:DNA-binding transcriptional LysR family regulator
MERAALVSRIWPWLPAFRAIAESEHLPTAARRLHVVPSALSRTLRLLEEALGERLFTRAGRRLALNARGRALLEAVRAGEEAVARGAARAVAAEGGAPSFAGELRVGTLGVLTNHVVLPELLALVEAHPALVPILRNARAGEANHRLALGELDVAFYYDALPASGLTLRRLGVLTNGIYCGRAHPLFRARRVDRARLLEHAFSVPAIGDRGTPMDNWPVDVERKVGMQIELLQTNLEVCRSGRFVTVLPDVVAAPYVRAGELRRFAVELVPPVEVYAAARAGDDSVPAAAALVEAVARRVAGVGALSESRRD